MRPSLLLTLVCGVYSSQIPPRDYETKSYFAVELDDRSQIRSLLLSFPHWHYEHDARGNPGHYVFSQPKHLDGDGSDDDGGSLHKRLDFTELELSDEGIRSIHQLSPRRLVKRAPVPVVLADPPMDSSMQRVQDAQEQFQIQDPEFASQWHLINPSYPSHDVNVTGVWAQNITGNGVVAAVIDDGLDYESKDLADNFCEEGSWDYNANQKLPKPTLRDDYHGTRCAGEIAAVKNDVCGVGVGFNSKVSGIRILSGDITQEDEAAALVYGLDVNDIYSCSWGPSDNGKTMEAPSKLVKRAIRRGVQEGRKGKGAIYVFASGNGGMHGDNCNYDGYTNSIYSITVGALDHKGLHPPYSEACSAVLVVTYSSGSGEYIHSTDLHDQCTAHHGGTSAAAPLAAGVYTLVLEANPELTWRDVQYITILSSDLINENDGEYQDTAMGKKDSHKYGYGRLDAWKIVELAKTWENVNEQVHISSDTVGANVKVGKEYTHEFDIDQLGDFKNLEHVQLHLNMDTSIRGQVSIDLISPSGTVSNLGVVRKLDKSKDGFKNWTFMTVAHWGDRSPNGKWKVRVENHDNTNNVVLKDFKLSFYGQKKDNDVTEPVNAVVSQKSEVSDLSVSSEVTSSSATSVSSVQVESSESATTSSEVAVTSSETSPVPTDTQEQTDDESKSTEGQYTDRWSPHYVNYFLAIIVVGFFAILIYNFVLTRRLIRRREQYEFDIIRPDDTDTSEDDTSIFTLDTSDNNRLDNIDVGESDDEDNEDSRLAGSQTTSTRRSDSFEVDTDEDDDGDNRTSTTK